MGTDQRDLFVPALRRVIEAYVPTNGHILDFGREMARPNRPEPLVKNKNLPTTRRLF
jgi:hypothetical protein